MSEMFLRVTTELCNESERGAVILAFAWMDDELTNALKKFLIPTAQNSDELLGVGRPIGDAATKIDLAFRLGIINDGMHKSLHLVRRLRNDFSHTSSKLTFQTDSVRDRVNNLFQLESGVTDAILSVVGSYPETRKFLLGHGGTQSQDILSSAFGTKFLFHILAGVMVTALARIAHDVVQISQAT